MPITWQALNHPSLSIIRGVLIRINPVDLNRAPERLKQVYDQQDETLSIGGETMCIAIDGQHYQTRIMSAIGHHKKIYYTQKKSDPLCIRR